LRFAVVLAKQDGALPKIIKPFYFYLGGKIGTGHQPFSWITIDDVMRAIGDVLHKPDFTPTSQFLLKLIFREMAKELLLDGQFVYPTLLLDNGFQFSFPDIKSALQHILL